MFILYFSRFGRFFHPFSHELWGEVTGFAITFAVSKIKPNTPHTMKAKFFLPVALLSLGLMTEAQTKRTFVHPGGLHTEADFQRMREHKNETPWAQS